VNVTPTQRRLYVTLVAGLVVALNSRLGLGLSDEAVQALVALAVGYLVQSAGRQAFAERSNSSIS
jgi:hypothetical protein